jgi:hypothetical protein
MRPVTLAVSHQSVSVRSLGADQCLRNARTGEAQTYRIGGEQNMRHEEFAQQAAKHLEAMAASLEDGHPNGTGDSTTSARANELRLAAHVVLALSEAAARAEGRRSSVAG